MAFSGILVTAGYVGSYNNRDKTLAMPGRAMWSESGTLPYTTTKTAPPPSDSAGDPCFTIVSDVDTVVSIGPSAVASGARYLVHANVERTIYAQPNDKLAAAAA